MNLKLKELRKSRGMRQEDLADAIFSTPRIVGAWERGETSLPLEDACSIADVLECTLDELAGREWVENATAEETELVNCYREAPKASKDLILHTARVGRNSGQALNSGHTDAVGIA
ncbi:MAG: helix-turn-helix transcriptional regulator [Rikenellaceae bacterium]|nr:helix-turn-helix transcriptional regulator [Rikenellaceae bacterium]